MDERYTRPKCPEDPSQSFALTEQPGHDFLRFEKSGHFNVQETLRLFTEALVDHHVYVLSWITSSHAVRIECCKFERMLSVNG